VYDVYIPNSSLGYTQRHKIIVDTLITSDNNLKVVPYKIVNSIEELKDVHTEYISQGYEGTMVRIDDVPYELNKRSY